MPHKKNNPKVPNFKICLKSSDKKYVLGKVRQVLDGSRWTKGPLTRSCEEKFKKFVGAPYAIALSNGGVSLIAILQAMEIPEGSVVICPTMTAPPTPHAILAAGMKVVFADSSTADLGLSVEDVERKLKTYGSRVKAVITVHVGGWISPRVTDLARLCEKYGIPLIEDCAHAHGSFFNGKHAGSFGWAASYSFFMTKSLTCGEGGMVTSGDKELIEALSVISNYGKDDQGCHVRSGFNYRMSEFNAAVALWASVYASRIIGERRKLAAYYDRLLAKMQGITVFKVPGCRCGYYKYIALLDKGIDRDLFRKRLLEEHGVELAGGIYDTLCHQESYFRRIPDKILNADETFPLLEDFSRRQICLPLYPGLKKGEQEYAAGAIRLLLKKML